MNAQLVAVNGNAPAHATEWTADQKNLIKDTVAKGATDTELKWFFQVCQARQLNPFTKEIWFIKRGGTPTIQVSIDGFRLIANRSGKLAGIKRGAEWRGDKLFAWAEVYRSDWQFPAREEVSLDEYRSMNSPLWNTMPEQMLKKCAEAQALRMAFPESLSGIYGNEEMSAAGHQAEIEAMEIEKQKQMSDCIKVLVRMKEEYGLTELDMQEATGHETLKGLDLNELEQASLDLQEFCMQREMANAVEQDTAFEQDGDQLSLVNEYQKPNEGA